MCESVGWGGQADGISEEACSRQEYGDFGKSWVFEQSEKVLRRERFGQGPGVLVWV
jgi:hypothetical protein